MNIEVEETVRRIVDAYTEILMADRPGRIGRWLAFALEDGSTNGVVYDSRAQAVAFNRKPSMFLQLHPDGMRPRAARALITFHRSLHEAGFRTGDPDMPTPIPTNDDMQIGGTFDV